MGGAIGAVMLAGSMKTLQLSLETSQVARSTLSEAEFRHIINQFFTDKDKCLANFKPKTPVPTASPYSIGLYGDNREWGVGEVFKLDSAIPLEKGGDFKGDLKIVKMELKGDLPTTPPPPDDDKITKKEATRHFIVYYKKRGLGSYSTVGGADCKANNLSGCYFNRCVLTLKLEPNPPDTKEEKCESTCTAVSGGGGGSGNPDCYKVDDSKTLVGCGNTKDITATGTTAIGYDVGHGLLNTASYNTFLGAYSGYKTSSGQMNVFIGSGAGRFNTTGSDNTFIGTMGPGSETATGSYNIAIGSGVKVENPNNDNQINIGNIIKAKQQAVDPADTTKGNMGVLKVCNADGSECKALGKEHRCPAGEFIREIKNDGTVVCESACSGLLNGKRLFETITVDDPVGNTRTLTYDLRTPYVVHESEDIVSRRRHCSCPGNTEMSVVSNSCVPCRGNKKKMMFTTQHKCMYCAGDGATWRKSDSYGNKCVCPSTSRLKKKRMVMFV